MSRDPERDRNRRQTVAISPGIRTATRLAPSDSGDNADLITITQGRVFAI